jgi:hypothetical protein
VKDDDAKRLFAYVQAVRKQGGKLLMPRVSRTPGSGEASAASRARRP